MSSPAAAAKPSSSSSPRQRLLLLTALAAGASVGYFLNSRPDPSHPYKQSFSSGLGLARAYSHVAPYALPYVDPEKGHRAAVRALSLSHTARAALGLTSSVADPPLLHCSAFGLSFPSPVGIAAGFDKDGECIDGLLEAGFGWAEIGSVTPEPQPGNEGQRVWRLQEDRAIINRYGFNSAGAERVRQRLEERKQSAEAATAAQSQVGHVLGINLGKNKTSPSAIADYRRGLLTLHPYADYFVINVSSPNTPGLRDLQHKAELQDLLTALIATRDSIASSTQRPLPLLLKISPDLTDADKQDIADVALATGVDGLVIANTTLSRPGPLRSAHRQEAGGLSGAPLRSLSTQLIRDMYLLTDGRIPIVGVGGVSSGADVLEKLRAGACLVQLYSAFSFEGPMLLSRVKEEIIGQLRKDGVDSVQDVVGRDVRDEMERRKARVAAAVAAVL